MALVKGTNSYVDLEQAEAYFEDRLDVAAWTDADDESKEQALVTATMLLEEQPWTGYAASETQLLAFPRSGEYFDPRLGLNVQLVASATEVPERLKKATYELAYHLLNNDGLLDESGQVVDVQVGSITLNTVIAPNKLPNLVRRMIKPLLVTGGGRTWFRAN